MVNYVTGMKQFGNAEVLIQIKINLYFLEEVEMKKDLKELSPHVLVEKDRIRMTGEGSMWEAMEEGSFSVVTEEATVLVPLCLFLFHFLTNFFSSCA